MSAVRRAAPAHGTATPVTDAFVIALTKAVDRPPPAVATTLFGLYLEHPRRSEALEVIDRTIPGAEPALRIGACLSPATVGAAAAASAVVAGAEVDASADRLIAAFAVACETELRIRAALAACEDVRRWDLACAVGVVAAAVAASLVGASDEATLRNSVGIAGAQILGRSALRGSAAGAFALGRAAANGHRAHRLAREGFTGPRGIFDAERGYLHLLCDRPDLTRLHFAPERQWLLAELNLPRAAFEPVPARKLLTHVVAAIA